MTEDQLAAIEARAEAATAGRWRALIDVKDRPINHRDTPMVMCDELVIADVFGGSRREENTVFITEARADIPALVAEVRRLRELCAECIESIEDWAGYASDYYREKHGYEGEINDYKARLNGAESEGA